MNKPDFRKMVEHLTTTQMVQAMFCDIQVGTLNRRAFEATTSQAVAFIDVDSLKWVNDVLGHDQGDALLIEVAEALQKFMGEDRVYRLSGDEFAVRMDDIGALRSLLELAQEEVPKFSFGIGTTLEAADYSLRGNKEKRTLTGRRAIRGCRPPWA